jgi:hypothetical protein
MPHAKSYYALASEIRTANEGIDSTWWGGDLRKLLVRRSEPFKPAALALVATELA